MPESALPRLLEQAHGCALEYLETLDRRPVFPDHEALAGLAAFEEPLPDAGCDGQAMLRLLHEHGSPATVAHTGGRYFGFVTGAVHPPALAARWLTDTWDQNAALQVMSPVTAKLESVVEQWLVELLQLPRGTVAGFVSGTSMSLLCGLAAARGELLHRQGWDVNALGLYAAPVLRVVLGAAAHATVFKALALLGLGREHVTVVPCDDQGRMRADALPALHAHTLLIAQAGHVNTGAFDPFEELCDRASEVGCWVHVDGAFGLWAAASPLTWPLYAGAERADSWSADAHKTLNAPYDSGIVLCRHPGALVRALQADASYLQWSEQRDGMAFTPEMSRRARALELWAIMKTLGRTGMRQLVDQLCARARQFADELRDQGFQVVNDVVFNQVLVSCGDSASTGAVADALQRSGECWCGTAQWRGETVIRISVCSWATTPADVSRSVAAFVAARR